MKRWQKVIVGLLAAAITATVGWRPFLGPKARPLTERRIEPTPARLERGEYLVRNVSGCLFCHSDLDPSVEGLPVKAGLAGAGRALTAEDMPWLTAPNLTADQETGAGRWTDDMLARAIREGIGHDGRTLFPMMPYQNYAKMSDEDLASVITYIRSLPAVRQQHPRTAIPFPVNRMINSVPQPIEGPVPAPDLSTPEKRGEYLATMRFAGGNSLKYGDARVPRASMNLTPAPSGIPYYNEALFVETIRTGRVRERQISDVMPWGHYRGMTDEDLKAIFAFLKTLPPVDHTVDNALPPTRCEKCGLEHGGGEGNKKSN
jgi:mono/diheme cytochrome c family protein